VKLDPLDSIPLTVWMNMPSPYQADFFRELARRQDVDLRVVFGRALDPMRTTLGWSVNNDGFNWTMLPERRRILHAIHWAWRNRDRVHVVNAVWALPEFVAAASVLMLLGAPVYFHGEVSDPREARSFARLLVRNNLGRVLLRGSRGIFAISRMAERFYADLAGGWKRIFPFAYFKHHEFSGMKNRPRDVAFVGQLVTRKAVDVLLTAFASVANEFPDARLVLMGSGPEDDTLRTQAQRLGVSNRVKFTGAVSSSEIDARIAEARVLVLPSRFDGWGLVVNEALAAGVPVVVTDMCGAADLIQEEQDGIVVPVEDPAALATALRRILARDEEVRPDCGQWRARIGLPAVVDYFLDCLRRSPGAPLPRVPWKSMETQNGAVV